MIKERILNGMKNLLMGGFIVLAVLVFLNGIFFQNSENSGIHIWVLTVCMIALFIPLKHFYKEYMERRIADTRLLMGILWGALILLQAAFLFFSRNLLRHDALKVYDEAVSIFYDGSISEVTKEGYFAFYANNYPITLITFLFLKIGRILHLVRDDFQNGIFYLQWINLAAVDISLFAGFLFICDNFKDKAIPFCYMVFLLLSPLTYVWIPFYYTNTLSMPFYMAGLWLMSRYFFGFRKKGDKIPSNSKRIIYLIAAGFLLYIGYAIRATVIITVIAIVMTLFFHKGEKRSWMNVLALLLGAVIGICILKPLTDKYVAFDYSDMAFPAIHWIMMGAKGEGLYNKRDEMFTASFETAEEKYEADKDMLLKRLQELGGAGTVRHLFKKLFLTFGDGTGNYMDELSISDNYGKLYRCICGDHSRGLSVYTQAVYLTALFYSIIAAAGILKRGFHPLFLILVNILGAFLFYMIWEAGTVYSIGFLPLFYAGGAGGMDVEIPYKLTNPFPKVKLSKIIIPGILMMVILCDAVFLSANRGGGKSAVYQVNQFMFQTDNYQTCSYGTVLQQTFESNGLFNCISVQARNPQGELNDSVYVADLEDDTGKLYDSFEIKGSDVFDYAFVPFLLERPLNKGRYKLTLKKVSGVDDLIWLYYDTGNYDAYKKGKLTGLLNVDTIDLAFKVYYGEEEEGYFEWYEREISK